MSGSGYDPQQNDDQGGGHGALGLFAGIIAALGSAAPLLRSCDDVARVARPADELIDFARPADEFGSPYAGGRVRGSGSATRFSEPSGWAADNEKLATYASSERAEFERHVTDFGDQVDALRSASGQETIADVLFQVRKFRPAMRLLYAAPRSSDEFAKIFDRSASANEFARVAKARARLSGMGNSRHVDGATELLRTIDNDENSIIIIVGHNDSGTLRLGDGSRTDIMIIAQHCEQSGRLCVILSCNSNRFLGSSRSTQGVDDTLTYSEAHQIGSEIDSIFARLAAENDQGLGARNLVKAGQIDALVKISIDRSLRRARSERKLRQSGKLVSFSAGGGLIVYGRDHKS